MIEQYKKMLRPSSKWTDIFVIAVFLSLVLAIGGQILSLILNKVIPFRNIFALVTSSENAISFMSAYFDFFGIWILFFLIVGIFKWNRPILQKLAPNSSANNIKGILIGILIGFGSNGFCILMSVLLGNIKLTFNMFSPLVFLVFFFVVFIQSGAEELCDRVYLYQKLRRRYKAPLIAIAGNAIVFTALHLTNPGITVLPVISLLVTGLLYSVLIYYYDCTWTVMMIHTTWNFTQSIVFGLPNSGVVSQYSLFSLDTASATSGLFYDTAFGVEGSIGAIAVDFALLVAVILINRGKPEKADLWAQPEEKPAD